ncbi:phage major capsid, P2 family protein [Escherichia coli 2872000]|nr:phage major capsid, P2 family protein [Escherichia coli 2872000]
MDATNNLIEPWYQEDPDLVVIVGVSYWRTSISHRQQGAGQQRMLAADVIISQKRIGTCRGTRPVLPGGCDAHHEAGKPVHLLHG